MNRIDIKGERTTFILYWGGHETKDTGNWGFSYGGEITCHDVINTCHARTFADDFNDTSSLTIIASTCYSDAWIETLRTENIPRSLLMRKFIIEQQYSIGWYLWTCIDQHPTHLCDYGETKDGEDFSAGQQRTLVHGGPYYFFYSSSILDNEWKNIN
ncbi:unnamed protein product [Rotaria magnacalcarata]|uniref:Uncharacterized protein n=2 Tax=Rotaria magnacalcarata TaxID=392030 RepID=A0A815PRM4_9BILA|nr:unnamed protein product [Rotaria magnacalcarata]CAF4350630.1 unnamed protein product [Rotaria magnacalcarata]